MKNIKKWLMYSLIIVVVCFSFLFVSCNQTGNESSHETENITLNKEKVTLLIGDEFKLGVFYESSNNERIVRFRSSDEGIVKVDEETGIMTAVAIGQATVIAECGEVSADCIVNVGIGNEIPCLIFEQNIEDGVCIAKNDILDLSAYVTFNGKKYNDVVVQYAFDDTFGKIEDGVFTPLKCGETKIKISAKWRGVESEIFDMNISVKIIDSIELYVNDGATSIFELFTSEVGGETKMPFIVSLLQNGNRLDDVSIRIEDETIATYTNGELIAVGEGETFVTVSHEIGIQKRYPIRVQIPIVEYQGQPITFSALDGELDSQTLLGTTTFVRGKQGERTLTLQDGKILGVEVSVNENGEIQPVSIILYTDKIAYEVKLLAYTKIIKTAQDLAVLDLNEEKVIKGYYILANDIAYDETWTGNQHSKADGANQSTCSFGGVFDGAGHSLKVAVGRYGLFGNLAQNAIVKNAYIEIVNLSYVGFGICGAGSASNRVTMDNVYISVNLDASSNPKNTYAMFANCQGNLTMTNSVIDLSYSESAIDGKTHGTLFMATNNPQNHYFKNVFVITSEAEKPLIEYYSYKSATNTVAADYAIFAENEGVEAGTVEISAENDRNGCAHIRTLKVMQGIRRYTSYAQIKADEENYQLNGFKESYWDISANVPIYEKAIEKADIRLTVDGQEVENIFTIENVGKSVEISAEYRGVQIPDAIDLAVTLRRGGDYLSVNEREILALDPGTATIRISYILNGEKYTQDIQVLVGVQSFSHDEKIEFFSAADGDIDLSAIFQKGETFADIVSATQIVNGETVNLEVDKTNSKILGVTPNIVTATTATTYDKSYATGTMFYYDRTIAPTEILIVTNKATQYTLTNVMAYTKVLDESSDWSALEVKGTPIDGYYILKNDITLDGTPAHDKNEGDDYVFKGVFDGNGKKVTATVSGAYSLFCGMMSSVVKDAAFDLTITGRVGMALSMRRANDNKIIPVFKNVYIKANITNTDGHIFGWNDRGLILDDCLIDIVYSGNAAKMANGLLSIAFASDAQNYYCVKNTYVVVTATNSSVTASDISLVKYVNSTDAAKSYEVYGENETSKTDLANKYQLKGIKRYHSTSGLLAETTKIGNWMISVNATDTTSVTWSD